MRTVFRHAETYDYSEYAKAINNAYRILDLQVKNNPDYGKYSRSVKVERFSDKLHVYVSIKKPSRFPWIYRAIDISIIIAIILIFYTLFIK